MITLEQIEALMLNAPLYKPLHISHLTVEHEVIKELCTLAKRGLATMPRPIAEAPKDGTEILGMTERGIHESVYWNEISRTWRGPYTGLDLPSPTHFIPLSALEGE
jgi:hypothetical protein